MGGTPVDSPNSDPCPECDGAQFSFFLVVACTIIIYVLTFAAIDHFCRNRRRRGIAISIVNSNPHRPPADERRIKEIAIGCTECAICLGEYGSDENGVIRRTLKPCGHRFHQACIDVWLLNERRCPVCRVLLFDESSVSVHGKQSASHVEP